MSSIHSLPHAVLALEESLRHARDLKEPGLLFQALLERPDFLERSDPTTSPLLDGVMAALAQRLDAPRARWCWAPGILRHDETGIVHGIGFVGSQLTAIFHLERADLGLAAVVGNGLIHHARFRCALVPPGTVLARTRGVA